MPNRSFFPLGVDVVVRIHDPKRLLEFDSALFSLFNQTITPLHVIVVSQSFDNKSLAEAQAIIDMYDWIGRGHHLTTLVNVDASAGLDIRAKLLNVGIGLAQNRFLAFLDGDDYMYGSAYQYLVDQALTSGAAVTFGGIECRYVRVFEQFIYSLKMLKGSFKGDNLADLVKDNFCPIHSFIIDRNLVSLSDLKFNPDLQRLEDYDFLLRLCTKYYAYFGSRQKVIGIYNWHLDGRSSIQFQETDSARLEENKRAWNVARRHIWRLKTEIRSKNFPVLTQPDFRERLPPLTGAHQDTSQIPMLFPIGHFYSPIVNPIDIRPREAKLWASTNEVLGIDFRIPDQLALLQELKFHTSSISYPMDDPGDHHTYFYGNDQFPVLDAELLHAILLYTHPGAMIEVGSGFSSLVTAKVNRELMGNRIDFSCIEPYPRQFLIDGVKGISRVIQERVEDVDLSFFDRLGTGDILFIDSSHVAKAGSDVNYIFFEVLPRLRPGVLVHFHDIFLPDEYPKEWVLEQGRHWNEQYLLRAFLQFNTSFSVVWAAHFMGTRYTEAVQATFPRYPELGGGGSFWIQKIAEA